MTGGNIGGNTVYSDEVEVVNAIGMNNIKHKLIFFFWSLVNLSPEYLSTLPAGNLLAVALSHDVKLFGLSDLLNDFIQSMKRLHHGIELLIDGSIKKLYGVLGCSVTV